MHTKDISAGRGMMPRTFFVISCVLVLLLSGGNAWAQGKIYKCKNQQGSLIYQESPCTQDVQTITSWASPEVKQPENETDKNFSGTLIVKQGINGNYFLGGSVNGKTLTFVVDTGATYVSLPSSLALSAQIYCQNKILMQTANGQASACTAVIPKLKFGPFLIKNAAATISPNLTQPLLGMSALQQFKMEQENGELRISSRINPSVQK